MTGIAFLGCGFVANMYRLTLPLHPELTLVGVYDLERSRSEEMARVTGAEAYPDFDALLGDDRVSLVINLTNPEAHFATTQALLQAGKHVYSEKPLAMRFDQAKALVALAEETGLSLVSAPCTVLNPTAQTLWRLIEDGAVGKIRLIHAEMDDGMVHAAPTAKWINEMGVAWPTVDEFEIGCTVEHAGYALSWLCAIFGPVATLTAQSEALVPDKAPEAGAIHAPDYSIAAMRFESGPLLRLTNGIYAPPDHRLRIFGDDGVIEVADTWEDWSKITLRTYRTIRRRRFLSRGRTVPLLSPKPKHPVFKDPRMRDFCRGIAEMAEAIAKGRAPYTSADYALHLCELTLAAHFGATETEGGFDGRLAQMPYQVQSRFQPMTPREIS